MSVEDDHDDKGDNVEQDSLEAGDEKHSIVAPRWIA